ncbi:MAG: [ribosomal protein S5]-alanine N-acetyltransferase [Actinomycetota bacterium]|jgi:ribosomal-protein-alanine N-acetyltransferase|nr:[ribosomal protein S5]-alanine N-acetyltransferase [Actinomycetota bacterium]
MPYTRPCTRLLVPGDALVLAELVRANRAFLAPWQPLRGEEYFTDEGQADHVRKALEKYELGNSVPRVILDEHDQLVGMITLQSIIRGFHQSCTVGYWMAESAQGQGLASAALREATRIAFYDLRLHRVQAETSPENVKSQRLLERLGFVKYGVAEGYVKIAGVWQDDVLYQLLTPDPDLVMAE